MNVKSNIVKRLAFEISGWNARDNHLFDLKELYKHYRLYSRVIAVYSKSI